MDGEAIELASLASEVRNRKIRLRYSLTALGDNLRPAQLADEASRPLRDASTEFVDWAAAKATSPRGMAAAGFATAIAAAALWWSSKRTRAEPVRSQPAAPEVRSEGRAWRGRNPLSVLPP